MPRERRKWTEGEDAILRDAVLKGGDGACDWHLIASCIPGRTNKDCRKRWHYKVAATVNKGPWEVAEDERLWAAVQEHGSRWALVAQVVKTRNGDQCSKRWYDALDPSIDHSPWTPEEDARLLEAIGKHGRNWKAIVKAYFPRRTSLSAKNRYSLLIRKMEPKSKQSQSTSAKKSSSRLPSKRLGSPRAGSSPLRAGSSSPRFHPAPAKIEDRQLRSSVSPQDIVPNPLGILFEPNCQAYNGNRRSSEEHISFGSPLINQKMSPGGASYASESPECPPLSPGDWSGLPSANTAASEVNFPSTTPPGSYTEDMSFLNDLRLNQGGAVSFANPKLTEQMLARSLSMEQTGFDFRGSSMASSGPFNGIVGFSPNMSSGNVGSRIVTVLINSEVSETVNRIVNQIGREDGVSIAIHLG